MRRKKDNQNNSAQWRLLHKEEEQFSLLTGGSEKLRRQKRWRRRASSNRRLTFPSPLRAQVNKNVVTKETLGANRLLFVELIADLFFPFPFESSGG